MNNAVARDGVTVTMSGNSIICSNGESYYLSGNVLMGPGGFMSRDCTSITVAFSIVLGIHGGRMF